MVKIKKNDQYRKNFTTMLNKPIEDKRLTWKATGIFLYLWHLPSNWDFHESEIKNHKTDGLASLKTGVRELRKYGYLKIEWSRDDKGRIKKDSMLWYLNDHPHRQPRPRDNRTETPHAIGSSAPKSKIDRRGKLPTHQGSTPKSKIDRRAESLSRQGLAPKSKIPRRENQQLLNTNNTKHLYKQNTKDKGARKVDTFHSPKKRATQIPSISKINECCVDLWGMSLSLPSQRRVGAWVKTWSPKLITHVLKYTNTQIGNELLNRSGYYREKSALGYAYALLNNCRHQKIFTLIALKQAHQALEARRGKKRFRAEKKGKRSSKNQVYRNWGRIERTAQGVAMFRSGGFALTPIIDEDRKVAKFMIDHGMYTHDKNNIKKAQKCVRGNQKC